MTELIMVHRNTELSPSHIYICTYITNTYVHIYIHIHNMYQIHTQECVYTSGGCLAKSFITDYN